MPRGDWNILAAFAGLAALSVAYGLGSYQTALNYPKEERYQSYRYAPDKVTEVEPAALQQPQALEYREPCKKPKGGNESDLCAQWRAAKAAENSAFWAKWGFWVTVAGAFGLFATIIQGRLALARAAESNRIARDTAKQQLAAYVAVESVQLTLSGHSIKVAAHVRNFGATPARKVKISLDLQMIVAGLFRRKPIQVEAKGGRIEMAIGILPPNGSMPTDMIGWNSAVIGLPDLPDYLDDMPSDIAFITVNNGQISWEDVFGDPTTLGVSIVYEDYRFGHDLSIRMANGVVRHNSREHARA